MTMPDLALRDPEAPQRETPFSLPQMLSSSGRQRIVFCATGALRTAGGIASNNRNILMALREVARAEQLALDVLVLHEKDEADNGETGNDFLYRPFRSNTLRFAGAMAVAMRCCRLLVFDHVHLALPLLGLPRVFLPPIVMFAHGSESWRRIRPMSIKLFRRADRVLTNSYYTLRRMQAVFDAFDGKACPLGLPPQSPLQAAIPTRDEEPVSVPSADGTERLLGQRVLILVGRMDPEEREKGHRELIQVLPRLRAAFPDVQLLFVGPGQDRGGLCEFARERGVGDAVLMTGAVSDDRLAQLYRRSYAMVMPSRQEGFGLVYLEAMNWAKPCIACFDDGGGEVVVDGETGFLVRQPLDLDDLYAALARLLADPDGARAMGEAGWWRLHKHYTAAMYQERLRKEFQAVLDEHPVPSRRKSC